VNHNRFPKEDRLPDSARRDNKDTKGNHVEYANWGLLRPPRNIPEDRGLQIYGGGSLKSDPCTCLFIKTDKSNFNSQVLTKTNLRYQ